MRIYNEIKKLWPNYNIQPLLHKYWGKLKVYKAYVVATPKHHFWICCCKRCYIMYTYTDRYIFPLKENYKILQILHEDDNAGN